MAANLYDTDDYRAFLDSALEERGLNRKQLAHALGCSPSWISLVLSGRRDLDPEMVPAVADFLELDASEASYFSALVDLHGRSPRARRTAEATVRAFQRHLGARAITREMATALFVRWHVGAVAELASCEGFRPEAAWIAATIHPRITEEQAEEALSVLLRLGLLLPDGEGGLRRTDPATASPSDLPPGELSRLAAEYHRSILELGARSMTEHRYNVRHLSSTLIGVSEELYPRLVARLKEVEQELVLLSHEQAQPPNRVYALAYQLFPVTTYTDVERPGTDDSVDV